MPKPMSYAARRTLESVPIVAARQYRAQEVRVIDDRCTGCAASDNGAINKDLCNALPACTKSKRLDGRNVVFLDCGLVQKTPAVTPVYNDKGAVRYEHDGINVGTSWLHKPKGEIVEVVGDGMAGMPEVKFEDGHTIFAYPQDLIPLKKGGGQ